MRRTALKRGKPPQRRTRLRGTGALKRKGPIKRRPPAKSSPAEEAYKEFIRQQPCCAAEFSACHGRIDPHHAGWNHAQGEGRGTALKAVDWTCIPLCRRHHGQLETLDRGGPFRDWTKDIRRTWVTVQITEMRRLYDGWQVRQLMRGRPVVL